MNQNGDDEHDIASRQSSTGPIDLDDFYDGREGIEDGAQIEVNGEERSTTAAHEDDSDGNVGMGERMPTLDDSSDDEIDETWNAFPNPPIPQSPQTPSPPPPQSQSHARKNSAESSDTGLSGLDSEETAKSSNSGLSFFSLTKKRKKPKLPKIQSKGVVNYGVAGNNYSDSESDASSVSVVSQGPGYLLPYAMQSGAAAGGAGKDNGARKSGFGWNRKASVRFLDSSDDSDNDVEDVDDAATYMTPIPTGPPLSEQASAVLPSAFLRNRAASNGGSSVSDISEDIDGAADEKKRVKREQENVGRLVLAAKQQQSFAQAWFSAGKSENANALPKFVPPKNKVNAPAGLKKTSFKDDERKAGPIDLDSGDVWDGDAAGEQGSKSDWEVGSFNYTTHSGTTKKRKNKGFVSFGVPEDEDLTTYYQENKCGDRIVCTIGDTRCSLLALVVLAVGLTAVIIGGTVTGLYLTRNEIVPESSSAPSISLSPTMTAIPSISPSDVPSSLPSVIPTNLPTLRPTNAPSSIPSSSPSLRPSSLPSSFPTLDPSSSPTSMPSLLPSPSPTLSMLPSSLPSSSPTTSFSAAEFLQVGGDIRLPNSGPDSLDSFGQSISISGNGEIVAVGAPSLESRGSVTIYQYQKAVNSWVQLGNTIQGLVNDSKASPSIELSKNGRMVVLGEYEYDLPRPGQEPVKNTGAVRIFSYNSDAVAWVQVGQVIEGIVQNAQFGFSVAISDQEDVNDVVVAVGAPDYNIRTGRVTTFGFSTLDDQWKEVASVNGFGVLALFGYSISLSSDGRTMACGAPEGTTDFFQAIPHGYVDVYRLDESNLNNIRWVRRGKELLYEGDLLSDFAANQGARFGESVSLSDDGNFIAIGTMHDKVLSNEKSGSASTYEFVSNFVGYSIIGEKKVGNPADMQQFGQSVAISPDGDFVAVGARASLQNFKGQVFIYRHNGQFWDAAKIINGEDDEDFGHDVAITAERNGSRNEVTVAAGAPYAGFVGQGVARVHNWEGPRL